MKIISRQKVCSVSTCKNRIVPGISHHKLPSEITDSRRLDQWLINLNAKKPLIKKFIVCSIHFRKECFLTRGTDNIRVLKKTAIPTEYLNFTPLKKFKLYQTRNEELNKEFLEKFQDELIEHSPVEVNDPYPVEVNYPYPVEVNDQSLTDQSDSSSASYTDIEQQSHRSLSISTCGDEETELPHAIGMNLTQDFSNTDIELFQQSHHSCEDEETEVPHTSGMNLTQDFSIQVNMLHEEELMLSENLPTIVERITTVEDLYAWTGVSSFEIMEAIESGFDEVYPKEPIFEFHLSLKQRIYLTLIKLKTNLYYINLAILFNISRISVSRCFRKMVGKIEKILSPCLYWPNKDEIKCNLPKCFQKNFARVRTIFDCTEIEVPRLKCLKCRIVSYSHYKGRQTIKFLIGVSPAGTVVYMSPAYSGKSSDKHIFNMERVIENFENYNDAIMSDKGFHVENECLERGIELIRPHFLRRKTKFSKQEAKVNDEIAKARIHVERVIQRLKQFKIFNQKISRNMLPYMSSIAKIISCLVNIGSPILANKRF